MPKRKSSSKGYTSKGQRPNVRKDIRKAQRRDYVGSIDQIANKLEAHLQGKKVMVTIPNPDKNNTRERFIRVPYRIAMQVK
jgi:hypothetical protein|tara:strand:- start:1896 stop:2138 length:243 start_codon:yes stop_codon:yes gene_type:complete